MGPFIRETHMSGDGGRDWIPPSHCVSPSAGVDSQDKRIVRLARDLTADADGQVDTARRLFEHVRDRFRYSYAVRLQGPEDLLPSSMHQRRSAFCIQKAAFLTALGRAAGIPTTLAFQTIADHSLPDEVTSRFFPGGVMRGHAVVAFHLEGKWVRNDPTHDRRTADAIGCDCVEFSATKDQLLPATRHDGQPLIQVLEDHGLFVSPWSEACDAALRGPWQRCHDEWVRMLDTARQL